MARRATTGWRHEVRVWPGRKPYVWFHSDSYIPNCDCGDREWQIDLPPGFVWRSMRNPYGDTDPEDWLDVIRYANSLHPDHPDIERVASFWIPPTN